MDYEFHYYITALIARASGFDHQASLIIAESCQFVDDNKDVIIVYDKKSDVFVSKTTQGYDILLYGQHELEGIYVRYHFLPDFVGGKISYITKEGSTSAKFLITQAIKSKNPYLIGIAAHSYADTFAHQHFSGLLEIRNAPNDKLPKAYGHTYYGELPDLVGITWYNIRQKVIIRNNARFLRAAEKLFGFFCSIDIEHKQPQVLKCISEIIDSGVSKAKRIKMYQEYYKQRFNRDLPTYSSHKWLKRAVHFYKDKFYKRHNFEEADWYKFQLSIVAYNDIFVRYFKDHNSHET